MFSVELADGFQRRSLKAKKSERYKKGGFIKDQAFISVFEPRVKSQSLLLLFKITSVFKCTEFLDFAFFDHLG